MRTFFPQSLKILTLLSSLVLAIGCAKESPTPRVVLGRPFVGPNWGSTTLRPPTPTGFRAKKLSGTQVQLDWEKIPLEANQPSAFRLYRAPGSQLTEVYQAFGPTVLTLNDTGLTPEKEYTYYLTAMNIHGESFATVIKVTPTDKPSKPTNFTASAVSAHEVKLEFDDTSDDEVSFDLERKDNHGSIAVLSIAVPAYSATTGRRTYLDMTVQPEVAYRYRVKSVGPGGATLGFTPFTSPVTPTNIPAVPTGLTAVVQSATQVLLRWTDASYNATSFTVRRQRPNGSQTVTFTSSQISYLDTSALAETQYRYSVRANNGTTASSAYSSFVTVVTPTLDPPMPTALQAEILAPNQVRLTWVPEGLPSDTFEVKYRLAGQNYGSGNLAEGVIDPQYVHSPAAVGETQYYKVRAIASGNLGQSPWTAEIRVETPSGVPANPAALTLTAATENSLAMTWTGAAPRFTVQQRILPNGNWIVVGENVTVPSFTSGSLLHSRTYEYRVRAHNEFGSSVGFSNVLRAETFPNVPLAPSQVVATSPLPGNTVVLNFQNNDGRASLLGFHIFRRVNNGSWPSAANPTFTIAGTRPVGPVTFTDATVEHNKNYRYRIVALNAFGDSPYSDVASVLVDQQPDAPALTARYRTVGGFSVELRWNAVPFVTGYEIQRRVGNGSFNALNPNPQLSGAAVSHIDTNVVEDQRYTYRIRSKFGSVLSLHSNEVSVRPDKVPAAPSQLAAVAIFAHQVVLSFRNEADNQIGFQIYRKVGNQEIFLTGFNESSAPDTLVTFTLTGLSSQQTYDLLVKATNGWGNSEGTPIRIVTPAQ